ncbi:MAG: hypothetical protein LBO05_08585 [Deltaproteobacteria bacterium]|nr:hypothetical protein [Deltaproteobacteria bacterium]
MESNSRPKPKKKPPRPDVNRIIIEVKNAPDQPDEILTVGSSSELDKLDGDALDFIVSDVTGSPAAGEASWARAAQGASPGPSPAGAGTASGPDRFHDAEFLRVFEQPDVECLEEYCFLLTKYPQLGSFFEKIKDRVTAGQYIFDGPPSVRGGDANNVPVLTVRVSLKDDQQNYELSSLKLAVGRHSLDDSSLYTSEIEQKKAIINIFSTFVAHTTDDYPAKTLNLYDKLIFFKYIGYIISVYGQKETENSEVIRRLN